MAKHRTHSVEFKRQVSQECESARDLDADRRAKSLKSLPRDGAIHGADSHAISATENALISKAISNFPDSNWEGVCGRVWSTLAMLSRAPMNSRPDDRRNQRHRNCEEHPKKRQPAHQLVADAVWNERPIVMRYQSGDAEKERRVEPLGIVLKGGAWYLVAQAASNARSYRISRIRELEVLDKRFDYSKAFDIESYWTESTRRYEAGLHPNRAEIRLSPWGVEVMDEFLPPYVRAGAVVSDEADDRGWRRVTLSVGSIAHAAMEILRFGADAEVVEPPELRAKLVEVVDILAAVYCSSEPE